MKTYSKRTVCPACQRRVQLEEVRLTPCFLCPLCKVKIRVSPSYRQTQNVLSYIGAISLPYLMGARGVGWVIATVPLIVALAGLQAYVVKYLLPPSLEWCSEETTRLSLS